MHIVHLSVFASKINNSRQLEEIVRAFHLPNHKFVLISREIVD